MDRPEARRRTDRPAVHRRAGLRIQDITVAYFEARELAARRAAAWPPVVSEGHADNLPAVVAARQAFDAGPGRVRMASLNRQILLSTCEAAGVALGTFDMFILDWLTSINAGTCAEVAGWIMRAAAGALPRAKVNRRRRARG